MALLYDARAGTVRIGGADIRDVTLASLRDTVGVVTQGAHLFHDTIRANLAYARPGATEEQLTEAPGGADPAPDRRPARRPRHGRRRPRLPAAGRGEQRALKAALAGRTALVIAHWLSTIRQADQILVIDGGRIRERGSHAEQLAGGGLYAQLYRTQFSQQDPTTGAAQ